MTKKKQAPPISATQALLRLMIGNRRFVEARHGGGTMGVYRDVRNLMIKERGPFAIILSCSDSRAPSELLFDQGMGDLFVIRVAGNVVAPSLIGSVEFAAATTQARLVVVMGHTHCGAIQATYDAFHGKAPMADHIHDIVERIRPHIHRVIAKEGGKQTRERVLREAMRANVMASADHIRHGSRFMEERVRKHEVLVVGAEYDIDTGVVEFFDLPAQVKVKAKAEAKAKAKKTKAKKR